MKNLTKQETLEILRTIATIENAKAYEAEQDQFLFAEGLVDGAHETGIVSNPETVEILEELLEDVIEKEEDRVRFVRLAKRAVAKYGKETCVRAFELAEEGNGASTVGQDLDLTTNQADAAINGGRWLAESAPAPAPAPAPGKHYTPSTMNSNALHVYETEACENCGKTCQAVNGFVAGASQTAKLKALGYTLLDELPPEQSYSEEVGGCVCEDCEA